MKTFLKRILPVLLAALTIFALASCGEKNEPAQTDDSNVFTETEKSPETVPPDSESDIDWAPITETEATTDEITDSATEEAPYVPPETYEPYVPPEPQYIPDGSDAAPLAMMYHLILDNPYSALENLFVRPSELRGHIEALLDKGYTFIFADEYEYSNKKTVIMSFDDGYIDNYTEMFPIIKEYNVKVTVFMITNYINCPEYLTSDMIKEMAESGLVSFQSHTCTHPSLPSVDEDQMRFQFAESKRVLEEMTGRPVKALCYPTGAYDARVISIAKDYFDFAYTTVSTSSTAGYSVYELPRLRINRGLSKADLSSMIP